ncbi:ABC transporter substrate-binding protein [Deinococcus peraridilitoris]|uniref:Periplasmic component of amino acid ABC-type transporter/signal transduction system n=1 Tax=Deinococcus peraridilitoris (strain DSM 19664 / LMG 22246 / CIP 109416 / KR-200) TaxID=937777 RepID=L0A594_DEIPD|nr:ABC transporter substrate-binding protein [Deinococcus peraridilitoris]AFZ69058.1 periplasmic component of amino acid ABC-type transporter/signal transduction system [Deinococcus peraridilitoris DSM 19664]
MKKRLTNTVLVLAVLATATASARTLAEIKKSGTIIIATEGAFKPFNYFEGKKLTGFEVDLGEAVAKELGVKVRWVTQPFDSLLIGLNQGRYDFVIASHGITPERAKAVNFTNPHYCTGGAIVAQKGGAQKAADLAGKSVAVQVGSTYAENVRKLSGLKDVKTYPKDSDAQQALMAGRVDAWVSDKFVGLEAAQAAGGRMQVGDLLFQEKIAMAVQKENSTLLKGLNDALAAVQKNGTYGKLSTQYFKQNVACK